MNAKNAIRFLSIPLVLSIISCKSEEDKIRDELRLITPPFVRERSSDFLLDPNQGFRRSFQLDKDQLDDVETWYLNHGFSVEGDEKPILYGFNKKGGRFRIKITQAEIILTVWYFYDS